MLIRRVLMDSDAIIVDAVDCHEETACAEQGRQMFVGFEVRSVFSDSY